MKRFKLEQSQIAVLTAVCLAVGMPIPTDVARWDGRHIDAFRATKEAVAANTKGTNDVLRLTTQ